MARWLLFTSAFAVVIGAAPWWAFLVAVLLCIADDLLHDMRSER